MKTCGKWEFDEPTRKFIAKVKTRIFVAPETKKICRTERFFTGDAFVEVPTELLLKNGWRKS